MQNVTTGKTYQGSSHYEQPSIDVPPAINSSKMSTSKDQAILDLKVNNDTLDREREFYFGKLRDIEEMLQKRNMENDPLGCEILKILYASEVEQVVVDDKGNLTIKTFEEDQSQQEEPQP